MKKMLCYVDGLPVPMMVEFCANYFKMAWCVDQKEYDDFNDVFFSGFEESRDLFWTTFFNIYPEFDSQEHTLIFPYHRLPCIKTDEVLVNV